MTYILITRPEQHAHKSAEIFKNAGFDVLLSPAIQLAMVAEAEDVLRQCSQSGESLVITSPFVLDKVLEHVTTKDIKLYVTGAILAKRAEEAGFHNVVCGHGNAQSLLDIIISDGNINTHYCFLHGTIVTVDVVNILRSSGFQVNSYLLYQSQIAAALTHDAVTALEVGNVSTVLFYSTFTAQSFEKLLQQHSLMDMAQHCVAVCISQEIANCLSSTLWKNILISPSIQSSDISELLRSQLDS